MLQYLPKRLLKVIKSINVSYLYELRLRQNMPLQANIDGNYVVLGGDAITKNEIEEVVYTVCKKSIYSFEEQIKKGFLTTDFGERIGLCGEFVMENEKVKTVTKYSSLCIRIPHASIGVAQKFVDEIYVGGSVLIISKTGVGKTTYIRDFARCLSKKGFKNVTIIDERNEIACKNGESSFDVGRYTDVLTYSNKEYGFNQAVRTLNPEVIITDELITEDDCNGVLNAILSGVDVVATIHAKSIEDVFLKRNFLPLKNAFNYFVLLENLGGKRIVKAYDKDRNLICIL